MWKKSGINPWRRIKQPAAGHDEKGRKDMWKLVEAELRRDALKYAREALFGYRIQVYQVLETICQCSKIARNSGLLALEEYCENAEEEDTPLASLWKDAVAAMVDGSGLEQLRQGIRLEQYSGYQLYLAYLYFLGACMIKNYPSKPDILLDRFRTLIPEEAQEDYDEDFRLLREMWQKEKQKMDETHMEENFSKFSRTKDYFHKLFYHMEEEGICCMMEEIDYLTLEKALSCADKKLRDRFRKNLPEKMRQEISYRLWAKEDYWNYYGCDTEERREAMKRMICMAGGLWSRSLVDDSGAMRLKLVWI